MEIQKYLTEFQHFCESEVENHEAVGDSKYTPGTIGFSKSYFEDLGNKIQLLNVTIVDKGNEYLAIAERDGVKDLEDLKSEVLKIGKNAIESYVSKNKPS